MLSGFVGEQIRSFAALRTRSGGFSEKTLNESAKFAGFEERLQLLFVRFAAFHGLEVQFDRNIRDDGGEKFGVANVFHVVAHFLSERTFELVDLLDEFLHASEFRQEFDGGLRPDAGATRDVVGRVAHERQHIDDLSGVGEFVFLADGLHVQFLQSAFSRGGSTHRDAGSHQLGIILVGGDHHHLQTGGLSLQCECSDDVVGFKALHFASDNPISFEYLFDNRHGPLDSGRGFLTLGFVVGKRLVTEGASRRVEGHCQVIGLFGAEQFLQGIDETKDRGGVFAFGVDARRANQTVICTENECIRIEKHQFLHLSIVLSFKNTHYNRHFARFFVLLSRKCRAWLWLIGRGSTDESGR